MLPRPLILPGPLILPRPFILPRPLILSAAKDPIKPTEQLRVILRNGK